jgi:hypothetical protein
LHHNAGQRPVNRSPPQTRREPDRNPAAEIFVPLVSVRIDGTSCGGVPALSTRRALVKKETIMLKFIGGTVGVIFLIGLLVVIGLLALIF